MTNENMEQLLDIGIALSGEKDFHKLLELILSSVMKLTRCDAGTLYLLDEDSLRFKIMRNNTLNTYEGGDGKDPSLPPVKLTRESVCALSLIEDRIICIDDVRASNEYDFSGPIRYDAITGYHTQSMLVIPMKNREGSKIGVLQLINAMDENGQVCGFSKDMVKAVESVASQAAITIQNVTYMQEIKDLFWSFVRVMSSAVDERTPYNLSHTRHMAEYGERFLDYLNEVEKKKTGKRRFDEAHQEEILMSVWLHDIGKLVTPLEVMNKEARLDERTLEQIRHRMERIDMLAQIDVLKGELSEQSYEEIKEKTAQALALIEKSNRAGFLPDETLEQIKAIKACTYLWQGEEHPWLTDEELALLSIRKGTLSDEERKIMENHVVVTRKLLSQIKFSKEFSNVQKWAAGHHELLNGSGYPNHLAGEDIPQEIRIITILDIFDALVADDRPYKPGMPVEKALAILDAMANKEGKLDPELTGLFVESRCWESIGD